MHLNAVIDILDKNADRIRSLAQGIDPDQAHFRPGPEDWSMVEVINHLYDEEKEDFRQRLDTILHQPGAPLPPINPEAWVEERGYNERDLQPSLEDFLRERQSSLAWLRNLQDPDWDNTFTSGEFSIKAGDVLVSWVAHDQLHMRQLVEIHRALTLNAFAPYQVEYAGQW